MSGMMIAIIAGALMSIQGVFNTELMKQSNIWVSSVWVQLTALVFSFIAWILNDKMSFIKISTVKPWYLLTGGVIGAMITYSVIKSMEKLGPAKTSVMIVVAQVIVAYLIEVMGLFGVEKMPLEWKKILGAVIAVAGIFLLER